MTSRRNLWPSQALRREDSHGIPGVEKNDPEAGKVLHVARHEGKVVLKGCSGDNGVHNLKRDAPLFCGRAQRSAMD